MQTRRDQLHAYRFMTRRAMAALVTGEPDAVEPPMRRITATTISGIMIAILVAAVFAVLGLLRPGAGDDWLTEGAVIVERDTGAQYVMIGGELHPTLNYSSAILASGATSPVSVELVDREKLGTVEQGPTIGIPGLPDSVPAAEELTTDPVVVCSQVLSDGVDASTEVSVDVGTDPAMRPEASEDAVYVRSFGQQNYLLWRGERHLIRPNVASVLGIAESPIPVGRALLSAIPEGVPFSPPRIEGYGRPPQFDAPGLVVGQVIEVEDGSMRAVLADGVVVVSDIQARLLLAVDAPGGAPARQQMSLAEVSGLPLSSIEVPDLARQSDGLPATMPALSADARQAGGVCAVYPGGDEALTLAAPDVTAPSIAPSADGAQSKLGLADQVRVQPGTAMLAKSARGAAVSLIGQPGQRYQAASLATLSGFGYGAVEPVVLPPELLAVIPTGPALDPAAALAPAQVSAS